jgi:hypothetical protein
VNLYFISWPWDYHQQAAFVIMAPSAEVAKAKAKEIYIKQSKLYLDEDDKPTDWRIEPLYDKCVLIESGVYINYGNNC